MKEKIWDRFGALSDKEVLKSGTSGFENMEFRHWGLFSSLLNF